MTVQEWAVQEWADGLREMADFADRHPDLFNSRGEKFNIFATDAKDFARKARALGKADKIQEGSFYILRRRFGPHMVDLNIFRKELCEKVLVGTKIVSRQDPELIAAVPVIEVTEDVYEWHCPESILALD
jgi:hypothetical protein